MEIWDVYDKDRVITGKTVKRGDPMGLDEYHIVVHVWVRNNKGEFLISKRTPNKSFPNMWECSGGSAISGESSYEAAIREVHEELGLDLAGVEGRCIHTDRRQHEIYLSDFRDVWLFDYEANIEDLEFQKDEVSDAMWASQKQIKRMIDEGIFIPHFQYLDQLFNL